MNTLTNGRLSRSARLGLSLMLLASAVVVMIPTPSLAGQCTKVCPEGQENKTCNTSAGQECHTTSNSCVITEVINGNHTPVEEKKCGEEEL